MGDPSMDRAYERDMALQSRCRTLESELRQLALRLGGSRLGNDARTLADKLAEKQAQIVRTWD